jgi:tetratricopeptide (TPR) repeat protein
LTGALAILADRGPLLVLATRRPEPDPGVAELEAALSADPARPLQVLQLAPIPKPAEHSLARSLLGGEAADEILEVVCHGVGGNPLFLEERLASLLDTGALGRDGNGWRLGESDATPVPAALERLVRARADRLSPAAREAVVAASVLGEEVAYSALAAVSELGTELDDALAELVAAGLLDEVRTQPEPLYRFRHAVIAEATYHGLLRSQRRQLHARAGWALETSASERLEEVAAVLGRHFAAAGEDDRAVHYLEMAGDHAGAIFANEEAIASYRQALAVLDAPSRSSEAGQGADATAGSVTAAVLCEKLAGALLLIDRFAEARAAALAGLRRARAEDTLLAARLQYVLGNIEFQDGHYDEALAALDAAQELLGPCGPDDDQERVDLWLRLQITVRGELHFWRNEPARIAELVERARPLVEARGQAEPFVCLYIKVSEQHLLERRHRVDAEVLADLRRAVDVAQTSASTASFADAEELRRFTPFVISSLGLALNRLSHYLAWQGDLAEARNVHEQARVMADRLGSPGARGSALFTLAFTAWRGGDVEAVRELAPQAQAALAAANLPFYVAAAIALGAWVAWRDQRVEEALGLGGQAIEIWDAAPQSWPFQCLALWPLAAAHLEVGEIAEAVAAARRLLEPSQARLPDELEAAVQAACDAWDGAEPELAGRLLEDALQLARTLGFA